ncbi:divalent-cation tolerance protein CutA [Shewanella sp. NIFS-20-20]|uniref:divalent-cation tolerance protein CutA n=1 Tax=Shewanella sp. NIFS-20-20 TaxID=2853806 RepID=UPI001C45235B|nr:divalent-cation tolerance protein CutA [Shewanella sp. NIFS-20-20]MBV7317401.1 divalent-cation tolerance protein CutA [Shewanella sp. NIFS-20-20]
MSTPELDDYLLVLTTCPDKETAQRIAHSLVDSKLAACAQIGQAIESVYSWQGQTHCDQEFPLQLKCTKGHYLQLQHNLLQLHPYEVPQIIAIPLSYGLPAYFNWIKENSPS